MKKPIINIIGLVLILTVLSMVAVNSVKSGNDKVDSMNVNKSDEHDITSICNRIDRLSECAKGNEPKKTSIKSVSYRDNPYQDFEELETDKMSEEYLADYYPEKVSDKCSDKNVIDDYENTSDVEE